MNMPGKLLRGLLFALAWGGSLHLAASAELGSVKPISQEPEAAELLKAEAAPTGAIRLDSLDLSGMTQGWGQPQKGLSVTQGPLSLKGVVYPHGVGTHAASELEIDLKGSATRFLSAVGLDDARIGRGSIVFEAYVDGKLAVQTPVLHGGDEPEIVSVNLKGAKRLLLLVDDAGDGIDSDHGDWAGALIYLASGVKNPPVAARAEKEAPPAIASSDSPKPKIHGPSVVGTTPGRPFLFRIPATGAAPLAFAAKGLPAGLRLDPKTGILSGSIGRAGTYRVRATVRGPKGSDGRTLTLVAGNRKLALTPPMGWNSWYVWFGAVDDAKVRRAADWMAKSGLAAHGYQYICIDDCWEGERGPDGEIRSNEKFPNMKALADYIHAKGLKFGIYSSPGPKTCGGYEGSFDHEAQDAKTYAKWGVDLLKYDWCSYGEIAKDDSLPELQKPYRAMRDALDRTDRDFVYSLCQYGMGKVWEWGASVGGNFWRTTGDSGDSWSAVSNIGFAQAGLEKYAGPGRWNDPDMLQFGALGGAATRPTNLTPNEEVTQMTLWCLVSAPLLLSCDLSKLDAFTKNLLTNDEALDVNQDPMGKAAGRRIRSGLTEVWSRPLSDGSTAVGLFNRGRVKATLAVRWSSLGLKGAKTVRDLWRKKDLGRFDGSFSASVPPHRALFLIFRKP